MGPDLDLIEQVDGKVLTVVTDQVVPGLIVLLVIVHSITSRYTFGFTYAGRFSLIAWIVIWPGGATVSNFST
jgi:hypothetical protein